MSTTLELFPNHAVYSKTVLSPSELIDMPQGISEVIAIANDRLIPVSLQKGPFMKGDIVTVDGVKGEISDIQNNYVRLIAEKMQVQINNPKQVVSHSDSVSKQYKVATIQGPVTLIGTLNGISWTPSYLVTIAELNHIKSFELMGHITSDQDLFTATKAIFHVESVLKAPSRRAGMMMAASEEPTKPDFQKKYMYNKLNIDNEMSLPLDGFADLYIPRVYFQTLQEKVRPVYGYAFDGQHSFPEAPVTILSKDLEILGKSQLEVSGTRVFLKVAPEENLATDLIIQEDDHGLNFHLSVTSAFNKEVDLILEHHPYRQVERTDPLASYAFAGKLFWSMKVPPNTTSSYQGSIIYK